MLSAPASSGQYCDVCGSVWFSLWTPTGAWSSLDNLVRTPICGQSLLETRGLTPYRRLPSSDGEIPDCATKFRDTYDFCLDDGFALKVKKLAPCAEGWKKDAGLRAALQLWSYRFKVCNMHFERWLALMRKSLQQQGCVWRVAWLRLFPSTNMLVGGMPGVQPDSSCSVRGLLCSVLHSRQAHACVAG